MAYSKAYQNYTAQRVREDEILGYFGQNRVTTSVGNFVTPRTSAVADKETPVTVSALNTDQVGKIRSGNGGLIAETHVAGSLNPNLVS